VSRKHEADFEIPFEDDEVENTYPPEYLRDCADDDAREDRLAELRRRIELKLYDVDASRIAEGMLSAGDLGSD